MKRTRLVLAVTMVLAAAGCATPGYYGAGSYDRGYGYNNGYRGGYAAYPAANYGAAGGGYAPAQRGNVLPAQVAGAIAGGLLGAQVGQGSGRTAAAAVGAAAGAYGVGRAADPCQPDLNAGHFVGALAGGLLGAQVGGGRGRDAATALGAAAGSILGGNMGATPNPACR